MIAALLALAAASGSLEEAQAAFARADYPQAESLALAAAEPPHAGAALYLAGLARFRAGRAAAALEALDGAARAEDAPHDALFHFNRGACLYQLGRFRDAQTEYEEAARDSAIAAVSLSEAGFAALDAGAPALARDFAGRARAVATGAALTLVAELDALLADASAAAEYKEGISLYDGGRFAEAREHFRRATALDPQDGRSRIMSGAAAYRLGASGEARGELEKALSLPLDEADARAARAYLERLGSRWQATLRLAAGVDSDPFQTGLVEPSELGPGSQTSGASAVATAEAALSWRFAPAEGTSGQLAYAFSQLAYADSAAADRSLQQHELNLLFEFPAQGALRLGVSAGGQLAFSGLSGFRGLQAAGGAATWAALEESDRNTTRLDLAWSPKKGLSGSDYLTGERYDAALSQELRLSAITLGAGYQFRFEDIGTLKQQRPLPPPPGTCPPPCTAEAVEPYGYGAHIFWLGARASPGSLLDLEVSSGFEARAYLSDNYLIFTGGDGSSLEVDRRRRYDERFFASASASLWLTERLALSLRYDVVVSRSNLHTGAPPGPCPPPGFQCHSFDALNRSYDKHLFTLGTSLAW